MKKALVCLLVVFSFSIDAAPKRRAVSKPFVDLSTPRGWLTANAYVLNTTDLVADTSDLIPLRHMLANARVVGLGDVTHGSHELYTVKLRLIDFLVRELNFDVVAFEAAFAPMNDLNAYVQGGPGDPRAILHDQAVRFGYVFWNKEEMVTVVEWMRNYNAHRGSRPAISIAGADVYGQPDAWRDVVAYLRTVDPTAANEAEKEYACVGDRAYSRDCLPQAKRVYDRLLVQENVYVGSTSRAAFDDAVQNARVVVQTQTDNFDRDQNMGANVLWMRTHRSASGNVIYWAHNEHVSKTYAVIADIDHPAGDVVEDTLRDQYFAIGTMTAAGTYTKWTSGLNPTPLTDSFPPLDDEHYEFDFRQHGKPMLLVPLRGALPSWLTEQRFYNVAGLSGGNTGRRFSLGSKFDAVLFVDTTTPTHVLP
jgi:erythromycin esterase